MTATVARLMSAISSIDDFPKIPESLGLLRLPPRCLPLRPWGQVTNSSKRNCNSRISDFQKGQIMIRIRLMLCVLAGFLSLGHVAKAANAPGPNLAKLERTAQHVFQLADADKNGSLNPTEQAQADLRAEKAIRQLVHDNVVVRQI